MSITGHRFIDLALFLTPPFPNSRLFLLVPPLSSPPPSPRSPAPQLDPREPAAVKVDANLQHHCRAGAGPEFEAQAQGRGGEVVLRCEVGFGEVDVAALLVRWFLGGGLLRGGMGWEAGRHCLSRVEIRT